MIIEIQIRGQLLRRIVRNRFLAQAICIADLPGPGQKVVDHLDFGQAILSRQSADMPVRLGNGTLSTVAGHRVRLTQPVTGHPRADRGGGRPRTANVQSVAAD